MSKQGKMVCKGCDVILHQGAIRLENRREKLPDQGKRGKEISWLEILKELMPVP